jgi:hypothetical protein
MIEVADLIASRVADWAMRIWRGDRSVADELRRINNSILADDGCGIVGTGPGGIHVGLQYGLEPPLAVLQLGFLLFGQLWPLTAEFKAAMKLANKMWRQAVKSGAGAHGRA